MGRFLFLLLTTPIMIFVMSKCNAVSVTFGSRSINPIPKGLYYDFYEKTCPQLENIVKTTLENVFSNDPTSPASLLRLMFHDCQVKGCDASILIDVSKKSSSTKPPEMGAGKNFGIRKTESINIVKSKVEEMCPGKVSCADIIVLAAREAVAVSGGPRIKVPLGRRDSISAATPQVTEASLPSPDFGVDDALSLFANHGMTTHEMVAIIGAHTLGVTHCVHVMDRLYSPSSQSQRVGYIDSKFEALLRFTCPQNMTKQNTSFVFNDPSLFVFDNVYYKNSIKHRGILNIDAELALNHQTVGIVEHFAANTNDFFHNFASAFIKLSYAGVLTGNKGVIRSMCNFVD